MRFQLRRPSAGLVVGVIAVSIALSGSAVAATGALNGSKIDKNSIQIDRLTAGARQALNTPGPRGYRGYTGKTSARGATGAHGPAGPAGTTGSAGTQGPAGAIGAAGLTGATGPQGPVGAAGGDPNRVSVVGALSTSRTVAAPGWGAAMGTCTTTAAGSSSLDASGLEISVPNDNAFGGAQYNPPTGVTLNDISALSYTERYNRGPTGAGSADAPFVEIDVVTGVGTTASVSFPPYAQPAGSAVLIPGVWQTWDALAPDSRYSVNHGATSTTLATVLSTYGTDQVQDIEIEAGCGGGDAGSSSTVSSVEINAGSQLQDFSFAS
jgi:hypothetical protein